MADVHGLCTEEVRKLKYPNIAAERARHGLTVGEFAEKLKVSRKTVYNWENAGKIPAKKLSEMADLFGVTTDYLLEGGKAT